MTRLLDVIDTPKDLRRLSVAELSTLATEVREEVISIVSEVGGHFASTLGAVDLTLALHYVFDTPEDRIVWDTGHQAYAHKLICGRRTRLATIRQLDGFHPETRGQNPIQHGRSAAALKMAEDATARFLTGAPGNFARHDIRDSA